MACRQIDQEYYPDHAGGVKTWPNLQIRHLRTLLMNRSFAGFFKHFYQAGKVTSVSRESWDKKLGGWGVRMSREVIVLIELKIQKYPLHVFQIH